MKSRKKSQLYENYEYAFRLFLAENQAHEIILCGSFAQKSIHVGSDIDVFIIDEKQSTLLEGKSMYNGITISIIRCSFQEIQGILELEKSSFIRRYSSYIGKGKKISGIQSDELIQKAKECYTSQAPILSTSELTNVYKSIEKYLELGKYYSEHVGFIGFSIRMSEFINEMTRYHFMLSKKLLPNYKNTEKSLTDKKFKKVMKSYMTSRDEIKKYKAMKKIVKMIETLLEGYAR